MGVMIRLLITLILLVAAAGGGFYAGIHYRNQQIVEHPEEVLKEYEAAFKKAASDKLDSVKKALQN